MKEQEIVIFQADDGSVSVDVKLHNESLWLSLNQLADLFMRDKSVIAKHLKNIFSEEELQIEGTVANFATVQTEGNRTVERQTEHYNLDAIISVGYRVNSKRGTQFRRWSSNILKEHLMQGYTINKEKISEDSLKQLKFTVDLLSNTLLNQNLVTREGMDVIALIQKYAKTWDILLRFDENRLDSDNKIHSSVDAVELSYQNSIIAINELRRELEKRNEATHLFGKERENSLSGILGNVFQTFDGISLYQSSTEKAAHLLYFIIKDHPFIDGNKRIGCLLFLLFMKDAGLSNSFPDNNSLIALALLVAESDPSKKKQMIDLIISLITE